MALSILFVSCFLVILYLLVVYSEKHILDFWTKKILNERASLYAVFTEKYAGFLLLGILSVAIGLLFFPVELTNKLMGHLGISWLTIIYAGGLGGIAILINYFRAGKPANYALYPKARLTEWKPWDWTAYEIGWVSYLLGYEWLFRGFMFFPLVEAWGFWPATIINIIIYVLAHLPKGWLEMAGSVPFGLLLCAVAYHSGSFLAPWAIHCALALSNSYFAIRSNPEMKFVKG